MQIPVEPATSCEVSVQTAAPPSHRNEINRSVIAALILITSHGVSLGKHIASKMLKICN